MKFKIALLAALMASAIGAQAQSTAYQPANPNSTPATNLEVAATAVYGFKLKETGVSVEGGQYLAPGHFVGLEATYFRLKESDSFNGLPVYSREHLSTVLALYRFNWNLPPMPEVSLYAGAGAGVGLVRLRTTVPAFNYATSDRSSTFAGELQAGVKWSLTKNWGVKLGYRYFRIYDVDLFGSKADIHDNVIEAGVTYKF